MSRFKDPSEWRDVRDLFKTKICTLFSRGHCPREKCNFAHGEEELRKLAPANDRGRFGDRRRSPYSPRRGRRSYSPPIRRRSRSPDFRRREGGKKRARGDFPSSARSDKGDDDENSSAEEQEDDDKNLDKENVKETPVSREGDSEKGTEEKVHKQRENNSEMAELLDRLEILKQDIQSLESQAIVFQNLLSKNEKKGLDLEAKLHFMEQELEEAEDRSRRAGSRLKRVMKAHIKVSKTQEELKRWQAKLVKLAEEALLEDHSRPSEEGKGGNHHTRDDGFLSEDGMGGSEGDGHQRKRKAPSSPGGSDHDRFDGGMGGVDKGETKKTQLGEEDGDGINTHEMASSAGNERKGGGRRGEPGGSSSVRPLDLNAYSMEAAEGDLDDWGRWQEAKATAAKEGDPVKDAATAVQGKPSGRGWRLRRDELPDPKDKSAWSSKGAGGGAEDSARAGKEEETGAAASAQEGPEDASKSALSLASSRISFQLKGDKIGFGFKSARPLQKKEEKEEKDEKVQPTTQVTAAAAAGSALSPRTDVNVLDVDVVGDEDMKEAPSFIPFSSSYVAKGNEDEEVDIDGLDDAKVVANGRDTSALSVDMDTQD